MSIGKMKYNIMVKELLTTTNEYGEQVDKYYPKYQLKAEIDFKNAGVSAVGNEIVYTDRVLFRIWKRKVVVTDIIEHEGIEYQIISVNSFFNNKLEIIASRINV